MLRQKKSTSCRTVHLQTCVAEKERIVHSAKVQTTHCNAQSSMILYLQAASIQNRAHPCSRQKRP